MSAPTIERTDEWTATFSQTLGGLNLDTLIAIEPQDMPSANALIEWAHVDDAMNRLLVVSGDLELHTRIAANEPKARRAHLSRRDVLGASIERHVATLASAGFVGLGMPHTDWTAGVVALVHRFGLECLAEDLFDERQATRVSETGVDALIVHFRVGSARS